MDQIGHVKSQLRLRQWAEQIDDCQRSGMSVTGWCSANGIATNTYYYRLKKVRENMLDSIQDSQTALCEVKSELSFKQLEVASPVAGTSAAIAVHLPQATIEVPDGMSRSTIEAVLLALKSVC